MKRKYYKFTPKYMLCLKYAGLCPLGCDIVTYASHKARKRAMYIFGKRRPHAARIPEFPFSYIDTRKLKRLARKMRMSAADYVHAQIKEKYIPADGRTICKEDYPALFYALRAQNRLLATAVPSVP